jgi:hypothetical protein
MARKPKASKDSEPVSPATVEEGDAPNPVTTTVVATTRKPAMAENTIIDLDMNLEDYEDYEILPDGPLPGECTVAEVRTSDKGNSYFYTMWKIDPKDFPIDYDKSNNPNGAILNYSRVQVPTPGDRRSITALKKFMSAMGLDLKTNTIDCSQWVGRTAMINIGHENYNGEERNSIKSIENEDA